MKLLHPFIDSLDLGRFLVNLDTMPQVLDKVMSSFRFLGRQSSSKRNPEQDTLLQRIASSGSVISHRKVTSSPSRMFPLEVLSATKTVSTQVQPASLTLI